MIKAFERAGWENLGRQGKHFKLRQVGNPNILSVPVHGGVGVSFAPGAPQFPPISVDPESGQWIAGAQIGNENALAQPGDVFEILTFVTDNDLLLGSREPLRFERPVDVLGVVHISGFVHLTVGQR
ncbi:MAG: hypothetical protein AB7G75_28545 [Candidatus Binatia bacterium]